MPHAVHPPSDRGVIHRTLEHVHPPSARTWVLAGTVLGSGLAFIDGWAVNLTLPVIQQALGGGVEAAQWIMNGYMLFLSALVLAGGAAADRYGRQRVFIADVSLFPGGLGGLRPRAQPLGADRGAGGAGDRRGAAHAGQPGAAGRGLRRQGTRPGGRRLGYRLAIIASGVAAVAAVAAALIAALTVRPRKSA